MKVVTWNCGGGFRDKFKIIEKLEADVYVIQECENPDLSSNGDYKSWANGRRAWVGKPGKKGLGIFTSKLPLEALNWEKSFNWPNVKNISESDDPRYFLPCRFDNKVNLLGVWAHRGSIHKYRYIGQVWGYLQINKTNLATSETLILGDFNSNKIWDVERVKAQWKHSDVVSELSEMGFKSLYHELGKGVEQGKEEVNTFYSYRDENKPYHIDYVFGSKAILVKKPSFKVGQFTEWIKHSDHMPITVEF